MNKFTTTDVMNLVNQRKFKQVSELLTSMKEADVADILGNSEPEKALVIFRTLPKDFASDVFSCLDIDKQKEIIGSITDLELNHIMEDLSMDDAVDIIEELPANMVKHILQITSPETRNMINQYLKFPENSAGSIMTAEYVALKQNMNVDAALDYIKNNGVDKETIYTCYVTDAKRHLEGEVTLKEIVMSDRSTLVGKVMDTGFLKVNTLCDQEEVARMFNKYDLLALPVVDSENRMVGIITIDDIMDIMEQETTEDIEKMAAIVPSEHSYMKTTVFENWKKRIPWLLILMVSATFTQAVISHYEQAITLSGYFILTSFIPMLMDTGGNCGSQASVSVIRAITLNEIEFKDTFKVLGKELCIALLCGITLSAANFAKLILIDRISISVAAIVCITLICTVMAAKLIGALLPMVARKIGFDPAVMASPLITTVVDVLSLIIYFQVAVNILNI